MDTPLNLSFPELLEGQEFLVETDNAQLKQLLDDDGSSDLQKEILRFTKIVYDLNRCPQSLAEYDANLKSLHKKYSGLSDSLRDYSSEAIKEAKQEDELMHKLTLEMCFAFKSYLSNLIDNDKWTFRLNKKAAFATNYAIHYLSLLKAEYYSLGKPLPGYIWRELNQLYLYAESNKLSTSKVKEVADNRIEVSSSILGSYARACLLSAITPYDLNRKEVWNLFQHLGKSADRVTISSDPEITKEAHCFRVDLGQSQRPVMIREQLQHQETYRYLNIQAFTQFINQELSAFASGKPLELQFLSQNDVELQERLLQKMYRYSVQYIARESDRYPIEVEANVVWGLKEIIKLLQSEVDINAHQSTEDFMQSLGQDDFKLPLAWQTVNESQGGACLQEQQHNSLKISDSTPLVVSKHLPNKQGRWQLAISRWHKQDASTNLIGIKYVKGAMQIAKVANNGNQLMVCIGPDSSGRHFLLTPKDHLKGVRNLALEVANSRLLAHCKGFFSCAGADLVQIEMSKKSI
ncbi:MAG: hypothetical protein HWE16_10990 [Gammaproteobacteria bacterium]|nr:hypothetical protein [Gammaproteobacteria bacterium]